VQTHRQKAVLVGERTPVLGTVEPAVIPKVERSAILAALDRFNSELCDTPDRAAWEQNKSYRYALVHEGARYPVKEIISLATGIPVSKFSGGESSQQANAYLRQLGFTVMPLGSRNPPWTRDELILALDLYMRHRSSPPGKTHAEVIALSNLLNVIGRTFGHHDLRDYRNPNGVALKLMNFRRLDPEYTSTGKVGMTHGNSDEERVWRLFATNPERLRTVAEAIRDAIARDNGEEADEADNDDVTEAEEGRILTRMHRARERDRRLILAKKRKIRKLDGRLICEVCSFDFEAVYGDRGKDFIECHHTKPVHTLKPGERTHVDDLQLLCSNCHRMVHVRRPWLRVEELRKMLPRETA